MEITKIKKILIIIVSILISIVIVSIVYNKVKISSKDAKLKIDEAKLEEVIKENKLVKDYQTFYDVNSACTNFLETLLSKDYGKTYKVLSNKYQATISYNEYKNRVGAYKENHFLAANENYNIENSLHKVYFYVENGAYVKDTYICQLKTGVKNEYLNLVIRLETSGKLTYKVWYLGV